MSNELVDRIEGSINIRSDGIAEISSRLLREAIAALRSEPVAWSAHGIKREDTCVWVQDSDGPWNTSCGKVFEFTNDGPAENDANFCYHCGGALLPEPYSDAAPSRETALSVGGAPLPGFDNPRSLTDNYKSRETDEQGRPMTYWGGMKAPSRETAKVVPVHSKSQYRRVAAQGGNPVMAEQRSATKTQEGLGRLWNAQTAKPLAEPAQKYRIWSGEHCSWWRPNACGYTKSKHEAGIYSKGDAEAFISNTGPEKALKMEPVEAEPALSAEEVNSLCNRLKGSLPSNYDVPIDMLRDMALSSLTARDEGIEAAARVVRSVYDDSRASGAEGSLYQQGWEAATDRAENEVRSLKGSSHD